MFVPQFIFNLIISNPYKLLLIALLSTLSYFATINRHVIETDKITTHFKDGSKYNYIVNYGDSYYVKSFDEEVKIIDGEIKYQKFNEISILLYVLSGFILLAVILMSTVGDHDEGWGFNDAILKAKLKFVECELENGTYYYVYKNKLLSSGKVQLEPYQIKDRLDRNLNLYPDFDGTLKSIRDKKLEKILPK